MAKKIETGTPTRLISKAQFDKLVREQTADKESMATVRGTMGSRISTAVADYNLHKRAFSTVLYYLNREPAQASEFFAQFFHMWVDLAGLPTSDMFEAAPIEKPKKAQKPPKGEDPNVLGGPGGNPWEEEVVH